MTNSRQSPSPLRSTDSAYRLAWILLLASLICPTIGGSVTGGYYPFAFYILANIIKPEVMPSFRDGIHPVRVSLFTLALFSNVTFLLAPYLRRCGTVAVSSRVLIVAALVVDLSVAIVLPDFAKAPGYWLWLASIAALVWTFVVRPNGSPTPAPTAPKRGRRGAVTAGNGAVPVVIWICLGWIVFWLAVTYVDHAGPDAAPHTTVARAAVREGHLQPDRGGDLG